MRRSPEEVDLILLGTGVAPLIAAARMTAIGKSVLVLNPDWDFFSEGSELSFDPLFFESDEIIDRDRVNRSSPQGAHAVLSPDFPGAVERVDLPFTDDQAGFRDLFAPHIRSRMRLWTRPARDKDRDYLDQLFLSLSEMGFDPKEHEGLLVVRKFPDHLGASGQGLVGVSHSRVCDYDVTRYRHILLEYVRERIGPDRVLSSIPHIEFRDGKTIVLMGEGQRTFLTKKGVVLFWTPRLTGQVTKILELRSKKDASPFSFPKGIRFWEEWKIISRDKLNTSSIVNYRNLFFYTNVEGAADGENRELSIMRKGHLAPSDEWNKPGVGSDWVNEDSFEDVSTLCEQLLKWDKYTIRSVRPVGLFEWDSTEDFQSAYVDALDLNFKIVPGVDGPLTEVVNQTRASIEEFE